MQPETTFHLAFVDIDILIYVCIMLVVAVGSCLIVRKRLEKKNARLLIYFAALLFSVSVLVPVLAPTWTTVRINGSSLRIEGLTFDSVIDLSLIDSQSARLVHRLPDSLAINSRRGGVSFSNLSFGWFILKNNRPSLQYVTSSSDFAVFTTTDGNTVILTLDDPERFITAVKSLP